MAIIKADGMVQYTQLAINNEIPFMMRVKQFVIQMCPNNVFPNKVMHQNFRMHILLLLSMHYIFEEIIIRKHIVNILKTAFLYCNIFPKS